MKNFISGLLLGVLLMVGVVWYVGDRKAREDGYSQNSTAGALSDTKATIQDKMESLNLTTANIKDEFAKSGRVVRTKMQKAGDVIANAASDAKTTTVIKGKLVADADLSALTISVDTTDGVVTLSGTTSSPENILKAMNLAWQTDGVREVISTLQIKE
jgi:osmotically-inducible protein OsmY